MRVFRSLIGTVRQHGETNTCERRRHVRAGVCGFSVPNITSECQGLRNVALRCPTGAKGMPGYEKLHVINGSDSGGTASTCLGAMRRWLGVTEMFVTNVRSARVSAEGCPRDTRCLGHRVGLCPTGIPLRGLARVSQTRFGYGGDAGCWGAPQPRVSTGCVWFV